MNKDVIYIEPEQDITDILANIKASKNKIIALVPPKKAGVLRSAVNFKLIAKTARQNEKTVVLITTDEALRRLANSVAMPTSKSLSSKPQLPDDDDAVEFGDEIDEADDDAGAEDEEEPEEESAEDDAEEETPAKEDPKASKKIPVAAAVKVAKKAPAKKPVEDDVIEGEPEPEPEEEKKPQTKNEKKIAKMKGAKIPNFAKYRKFIIAGAIALVVIVLFSIWATAIAPAAKISVKVHTTSQNFTEKVNFVNDESKSNPKEGILFLEEQTVEKSAEGEFTATGKVDKGTKASGKITITRPAHDVISSDGSNLKYTIPKGTAFTIRGKNFVTTEDADLSASDKSLTLCGLKPCTNAKIEKTVGAVAKENGEAYNVAAASGKDITLAGGSGIPSSFTLSSTAMTGGSSKVVTVVSKEDVETASSNLEMPSQNEIREELANQFGSDYIFLGNIKQSEAVVTTSPALNEEVGENITPKIVKKITYSMYAVKREPVKTYIESVVSASLGDDTQEIYDTGIDKAFFEAFQNSDNANTAKLKTTVKTGPRVTDEMVREKSLGYKVGEVQSRLKSIKGVSSVKVDTSYFFVMSVPSDTNKVEVNIEIEE